MTSANKSLRKFFTKALKLIFLIAFISIGLGFGLSQTSHAAAVVGFNAGNIISDVIFTNSNSMNVGQIQAFLNSKVTNCDTNGTQIASDFGSSLTHAQYAASRGWAAPPYTCLENYTENGLSAAQIIYNAAQTYQINPEVLIVLLQKEQGLITDSWPLSSEYVSATGYGCPDSTPGQCSASYYGFTNQINNAANMYHSIMTSNPNWYSPYTLGSNYVRWSPTSSCGGSTVNIQDLSTVALYDYTPYQPDQAALNAGYGDGDSCSAYGNRNFYLYFNDWFGSTTLPYSATYVSQTTNPTLQAGQSSTIDITYRNSGNSIWYDNSSQPTHLATANPINRASDFADSSWGTDKNRPSTQFATVYQINGTAYTSDPGQVLPGESVTFEFKVTIPAGYLGGTYREFFTPVVDGGAGQIATTPSQTWVDITVPIIDTAQWTSQSPAPSLVGGQLQNEFIDFKNTGNTIWYDDQTAAANNTAPTHLAVVDSTATTNEPSIFSGGAWGSDSNRPTDLFSVVYNSSGTIYSTNPHQVKPGEIAQFSYQDQVVDNQTPGTYRDYLAPVQDGGSGIIPVLNSSDTQISTWQDVTVTNQPSLRPTTTSSSLGLNPLSSHQFTFSYKNTGSTTLQQSNTTLNIVGGANSFVQDTSWKGAVIAKLDQASLAPGATGTFTAVFTSTQASPGTYDLILSPYTNDTNVGLSSIDLTITVAVPSYSATFVGQSMYPTIAQNGSGSGYFTYKNTGNVEWLDGSSISTGLLPTVLATTNPINRSSVFSSGFTGPNRPTTLFAAVYESDGVTLATNQHVVLPGQIAKFSFTFTAPQTLATGTYREYFQPILEGGNPWSMGTSAFLDVTVTSSTYSATFVGQSMYPTIAQNGSGSGYFTYKNTGTAVWEDTSSATAGIKPVVLATTNPINRISVFNSLFTGPNRPTTLFAAVYESDGVTLATNQHVVLPGQIAKFSFTFTAPQTLATGTYREYFQPILEGGNPWSMGTSAFLDVTVTH